VTATSTTTYTARDGAGIGGGGGAIGDPSGNGVSGAGAHVTITGGTVIATGGEAAAGIGAGGGYRVGAAGTLTVHGVAAAGSVTDGGVLSRSERFTRAADIAPTNTPTDHVFRAARAGVANSVRIDYPDAVVFDSHGGNGFTPLALEAGSLVPEPTPPPTRIGHTFAGWYADAAYAMAWDFASDTTASGTTKLHAKWDVISYPVTFVSNGGSAVADQSVDYGTTVPEPTTTREGHTLVGWFTNPGLTTAWNFDSDVMPASGITLYAKWTVNSYEVSFNSSGGSAVPTQSVVYGTLVAEPAAPTKEGNTFLGWYVDSTTMWDFDSDTMPASAVTLFAAWSINSYPVTFDSNGGSAVASTIASFDWWFDEPDDPTREGHTFVGWFADAALTTAWDFDHDRMPAHAITLYARWSVNSYEVSFAPNGGTAVAAQTLDYGTLVTEPLDPTRVGHTFAGWFADAALTTAWDFTADTVPASDMTLSAKWSVNSYLVSFDANGGSAVSPQSEVFGTLATEPTAPTREGHSFVGWFADAALTTPWDFAADRVPASDITLYADWSINSYLVSFATNGGTAVPPQSEVFDTLVTEPAAPTRDGHTFAGWFADAALTTAWDFAADRVPASAITLYTQWSIDSYTVTFDSAGGTAVPDQTIEYGSPIVPPSPPTRTDFVFAGWYDGTSEWTAARPVLSDVALTAHWTAMVVDVVPGSQQALIRWDTMALPSGAATSYTVAVEPGGLSCTTTTTACAVTGLAAGSYSAVVTAHWAGSSAVSDAVAFDIVDLTMPSEAPTADTPAIALTLLSGGSPITTAIPGARITVQGSGFVPGSTVELFVYSAPEPLGTTTADADGAISVGVVIPADLELGAHTIVARGFSADARDNGYGIAALAVVAPALSSTGVQGELLAPLVAVLMLLVLGAAGVVYARRRTGTEAEQATTEIGG
jgi:uncharacterized repeat protein (TIGR02543 family)